MKRATDYLWRRMNRLDSQSSTPHRDTPSPLFLSVQDADHVYHDSGRKKVYVPGGEGFNSVLEQVDPDHYLAKVPSTLGAHAADIWQGKNRDLTDFSWPSRRELTMVLKRGFTQFRTK